MCIKEVESGTGVGLVGIVKVFEGLGVGVEVGKIKIAGNEPFWRTDVGERAK